MSATWIPLGSAPQGGMVKLFDQTLTARQTNWDIPGIPQIYAALKLLLFIRATDASLLNVLGIQFNGDTSGNYDYQQLRGVGNAAAAGAEFFGQGSGKLGNIPAGSSPAGVFGVVDAEIPYYAGAISQKSVLSHWASKMAASTGNMEVGTALTAWRSAGPITSIRLLPISAAAPWEIDSRCILWGVG